MTKWTEDQTHRRHMAENGHPIPLFPLSVETSGEIHTRGCNWGT